MTGLFLIFGAGAIVIALVALARGRSRGAGRRDGGLGGIWFDPTPADDFTRRSHDHLSAAAATDTAHGHDGGSGHGHADGGGHDGGGDAGGDGGGGDGGGGGD